MTHLQFNFENHQGEILPHTFTNPEYVLTAKTIEEVKEAFIYLEEALDQGYYVAGYLSYEAAPAFEERFRVNPNPELPLLTFGVFKEMHPISLQNEAGDFNVSDWTIQSSYEEYQQGIHAIHEAIENGDTYQVNYTARLNAQFEGDAYALFHQLADNQKSSYSAYLDFDEFSILSASPELFFRKHGTSITTKPMKGTVQRGTTLHEDRLLKEELFQSEKDRSENVMIVDLLRNDLGRIAKPGTVTVPHLFDIETYPTVHQMTSTVSGEVNENISFYDLFQALFPCGSITGAPKIKTMDYISELEQSPRDVYCGAIGFITPERHAIFNVPIRTVWLNKDTNVATYGTGGGITWESTSKGEYEELWVKARLLTDKRPSFQLLETIRLQDGEYFLLDKHLNRLKESSYYFQFPWNEERIWQELNLLSKQYSEGLYKVRLLYNNKGKVTVEALEEKEIQDEVICAFANSPVDERNPFLYHKTTHRQVYDEHKVNGVLSTLLWNTKEELTEFTIGNLVVKLDDLYVTPPVEAGLLAGTYREYLLEKGIIQEKTLHVSDLKRADEVWLINGVKKWVNVDLIH